MDNKFRKGSKPYDFFEICDYNDETGESKKVYQKDLPTHLKTTNGCGWGRNDDKGAFPKKGFEVEKPLGDDGKIAYVKIKRKLS